MIDRFEALRVELERERALPEKERATNASDAALDNAIQDVSRAAALLSEGRDEQALAAMTRTALLVVDSWSYASPLSEALVRCKQDLQRTVDTAFARTWAEGSPSPRSPVSERRAELPSLRTGGPSLPRLVSYALVVVLTTAVVAVAAAVLYDRGWLALLGPVVAPVVALAALVLPLVWFVGRMARLRSRIVRQLRDLALLVREELSTSQKARATMASDRSLASALAEVEDALRKFAHGGDDAGLSAVDRLGRITVEWAPRAAASVKAARIGRTGRRLSKAARRGDRLATAMQMRHQPEDPRHVKAWDRWLIRFPVYSLLVGIGSFGLYQNGWVPPAAAFVVSGIGVLIVALWQLRQQSRT